MRRIQFFIFILGFSFFVSGCAVSLPFNNRVAYPTMQEAKSFSSINKGPIALNWVPSDFPKRIDVQGASGYVGVASQTRIPTGVALANRITELLDLTVGVNASASKVLTIKVIEAKSEFEYSAGIFNITPAIDVGRCIFAGEFILGNIRWSEKFTAERKDPAIGGTSQTGELEKSWDDIALQVARSVNQHMR